MQTTVTISADMVKQNLLEANIKIYNSKLIGNIAIPNQLAASLNSH